MGLLTVGVVTRPFGFEGARRAGLADAGLAELAPAVDTLIVLPNEKLLQVARPETTFQDAFRMSDEVRLLRAIRPAQNSARKIRPRKIRRAIRRTPPTPCPPPRRFCSPACARSPTSS